MIAKIGKMMTKREDKSFSYEELAAMLKTSPDALKTFEDAYKYHVQAKNDYWENDGESLTELIHKYRWYILKDALMQRGRDAVTDFIGTDISSSEFSRVLDETEMVMPDETFEKFWEKYI